MRWFRRKPPERTTKPAQEQAAPTPSAVEAPAAETAADTSTTSTAARRRRRGSRGGRNRRKPSERAAKEQAAKEQAEKPEQAEAKAKPERKPREPRQRQARRRTATPRALPPPAKRDLVISVDVAEQRVAILEDDKVAEVYLERPESRSIAGNIYKGTVDNVLPGMEAAFVEIGLEKNGFLYVDEIVTPELEGRRHGRKIQDLLSRGEEILVQAVKDPMKSKGARLTTEISLPGRFVVYVPSGEGFGVSRRLPEEERSRLREILKTVAPKTGSMIVRTAAEGASAEDIERDIDFLQRLWKEIQGRADKAKTPALVYQEAELPLRVVRDLFTNDFEQAVVDHDLTYKRIVGYLKKTSPHMAEKVRKHTGKTALFEDFGVEEEIRSTLSRRVDLPSGGYLVFDYAEAFTVIDVNTGRFVGSRSKSSAGRLEDTITKNNLEAVKEVVRQLRIRDIGGIIVIDFIDMANPKNRAAVEEALKTELERDRTKTYVVEISPLGLVEMTRQNVSHGPREILAKRCPTCDGDGIVFSEVSAAVEAERKLRMLAASSRSAAFRVELNPHVAAALIGPGAERLRAIEERTRRRFFIEPKEGVPPEHFEVVARGPLAKLQPEAPIEEAQELSVKPVEVGLHDPTVGRGEARRHRHRRRGRRKARRQAREGSDHPRAGRDGVRGARRRRPGAGAADHGRGAGGEADTRAPEQDREARGAGAGGAEGGRADGRRAEARKAEGGGRRGGRRRTGGGRGDDRGRRNGRGAQAEEADAPGLARRAPPEEEADRGDGGGRGCGRRRERSARGRLRPDPPPGPDARRRRCRARRAADGSADGRRGSETEEEDSPRLPGRPPSPEARCREGERRGCRRRNDREARKAAGRLRAAGMSPAFLWATQSSSWVESSTSSARARSCSWTASRWTRTRRSSRR